MILDFIHPWHFVLLPLGIAFWIKWNKNLMKETINENQDANEDKSEGVKK